MRQIRYNVPTELSEILCRYGCGSFLQVYLRLFHPFEYQEAVQKFGELEED